MPYPCNFRQYTSLAKKRAFKLNNDVSDHSTEALKGFGPKRVMCDYSRYRAMAKRQSTMPTYFKKADRASY